MRVPGANSNCGLATVRQLCQVNNLQSTFGRHRDYSCLSRGGGGRFGRGGSPSRRDGKHSWQDRLPEDEPRRAEIELNGIRINKCFADRHSRRESDRLIEAGRVTIDGTVALPGSRVYSGQKVALDGVLVPWENTAIVDTSKGRQEQFVYIKYYKPSGIVCTTDKSIRGNVVDAIKHKKRVFMVGRLDKESTGLLILTSDGRVVNAMLRSEHKHIKHYLVSVDLPLERRHVQQLAEGVVITTEAQRDRQNKLVTAASLPCVVQQVDARSFRIELMEGRNRQIRKMCEALGYTVTSLHRESFCGITLDGLKQGQWRDLSREEMAIVQAALIEAGEI